MNRESNVRYTTPCCVFSSDIVTVNKDLGNSSRVRNWLHRDSDVDHFVLSGYFRDFLLSSFNMLCFSYH